MMLQTPCAAHAPDLESGRQGEPPSLQAPLLSTSEYTCRQQSSATAGPKLGRVVAVDVLRGLTLSMMIFTQNASHTHPWWLGHAAWSSLHVADLNLASFLVVLGTAVALSLTAMKKKNVAVSALLRKAAVRTAKLIALGLVLQGGFLGGDFSHVRVMGVLQRIALVYASTALVVICVPRFLSEKALQQADGQLMQLARQPMLAVPLTYLWWWAIGVLIFVAYSLASYFTPIPGCSTTPPFSPDCNVAAHVDRILLGPRHMYRWPTCRALDPPCTPFDPEGLFSSFGAISTGFIGVFYGMLLIVHTEQQVRWNEFARTAFMLLAAAAAGVKLLAIPINKNLYTPSYICITGGITGLVLLAIHFLLAATEGTRLANFHKPFLWLSMNSIVVYAGNGFLKKFVTAGHGGGASAKAWAMLLLGQLIQPDWVAEGVYALLNVAFWMLMAREMFRRKIFVQL